jgi:hypothetical protein
MRTTVGASRFDSTARPWLALAFALAAAVLVLRAGLYPAVMTGDEIWFAESALNLVRHGTPQRLIHADAVGSAEADFLPPVIMLVQAVAFRLLGLTPLAVAAQSIVAPLAVIGLLFAIARRAGVPLLWAGLAGFAALGSQSFLRASLYIRYEALVAVLFLVHVLATRRATERGGGAAWHVVRGLALALAGLAYYPLAPFVGIAGLILELACWRPFGGWSARHAAGLLWLAAGFALPTALFGADVLGHPEIFAAQILGNGAANYLTFELPRRLLEPALWRQSWDALPELIGLIGLLVIAGGRWRAEGAWLRGLWAAALITTAPVALYPFYPRLAAVPLCLMLLILADWADRGAAAPRRLARAVLVAGAAAAAASCVLMVVTAMVQYEARRYEPVAAELVRLTPDPGPIAIDQRAWLAFRAAEPTRELHHVVPAWAGAQVRIFESRILREPAGGAHFRYVVLNAADATATIAATPALATAFAAGRFVEIGRVAPAFRALPWASQPPYDLLVYARRE